MSRGSPIARLVVLLAAVSFILDGGLRNDAFAFKVSIRHL